MANKALNILIIDDTQAANNLRQALMTQDFTATTADSAEKALQLLAVKQFDTIFIAPFVRGVRGGKILSRIRKLPNSGELNVCGGIVEVNVWRGHKHVSRYNMEYQNGATYADWDAKDILNELIEHRASSRVAG